MNEHLWAGADLKLGYAHFHLCAMTRVLGPANWTRNDIVQMSAGAIVDRGQQRALYPHFDAFLSAAHAVPAIIRCCFGHDRHPDLMSWFDSLSPEEQDRRRDFSRQLKRLLVAFRTLPLSGTRNTSEHRRGYPDVIARHTGRFGVVHVGSPTQPIPLTESSPHASSLPITPRTTPIELRAEDFTIDGQPLLTVCTEYLGKTGELIADSRRIEAAVHGSSPPLTPPPDA